MKTTDAFAEIIKGYLESIAEHDIELMKAIQDPTKSLENCTTYILNTVKNSGLAGFADHEVFEMAIEYYKTENIEVGKKIDSQVIINRIPELTPEEKELAKQKAFNDLVDKEKTKLTKKQKQTKVITSTPSLFD